MTPAFSPAALAGWAGAAAMLVLAILAGLGDRRRRRRVDLDRIGLIDWPGVQVFALIAAAVLASVAWHA